MVFVLYFVVLFASISFRRARARGASSIFGCMLLLLLMVFLLCLKFCVRKNIEFFCKVMYV